MKKIILLAVVLLIYGGAAVQAQQAEIQKVIEQLFDGMKNKNASLVEECFHPQAMMHTTIAKDGAATLGANSVQDFVNRIATTPAETILDERILSYEIKIDGEMASAWTPYEFYVNNNYSHSGVNSFQLIKTEQGWKITYVIDTRRKKTS
jgi:hypothetical protein